jgi:hypothetical protein
MHVYIMDMCHVVWRSKNDDEKKFIPPNFWGLNPVAEVSFCPLNYWGWVRDALRTVSLEDYPPDTSQN